MWYAVSSMSSELVLGIIGTITGIVGTITGVYSIYLTRKRMQRESPDLYVEVLDCRHKVSSDSKSINLYVAYVVHNKGDRGTRLNRLEALATDFYGKNHCFSKNLDSYLNAHDNIRLFHYLYFSPPFQYAVSMKCIFNLHHTHGVSSFQCESKESEKPMEGAPHVVVL